MRDKKVIDLAYAGFFLGTHYRKGSLNDVANVVSRIAKVNELAFIKASIDLFESLKRLCTNNHYFGPFWHMAQDETSF